MLTRKRLLALKKWAEEELCHGRIMKAPGKSIAEIVRQEPKVYLGWTPTRPNGDSSAIEDMLNSCPGILIAPNVGNVKNVEEKRFDTYRNIHRSQELGQWLNVTFLFMVYEPGIRLPGFLKEEEPADGDFSENSEPTIDMGRILEGTQEGLFALTDWMDECNAGLLSQRCIPGSDLILEEMSMEYGPYTEGGYISDKRPLFYGFINARFQCHADSENNNSINKFLD